MTLPMIRMRGHTCSIGTKTANIMLVACTASIGAMDNGMYALHAGAKVCQLSQTASSVQCVARSFGKLSSQGKPQIRDDDAGLVMKHAC